LQGRPTGDPWPDRPEQRIDVAIADALQRDRDRLPHAPAGICGLGAQLLEEFASSCGDQPTHADDAAHQEKLVGWIGARSHRHPFPKALLVADFGGRKRSRSGADTSCST